MIYRLQLAKLFKILEKDKGRSEIKSSCLKLYFSSIISLIEHFNLNMSVNKSWSIGLPQML